jgi:hypothetical protein
METYRMIDKKLLFVASAFALAVPAAASAQVAADTGATVNNQATTNTAADPGQAPADSSAQAADQAATGTQANAAADAGPVVPATAADVQAGATIRDPKGGTVGTVESVSPQGIVVATGKSRVQLPLTSFGKNNAGLIISVTRDELDAQAAAAAAQAQTSTSAQ